MTTRTKDNANQMLAKLFSEVFRAYAESNDDVQAVIREMITIINDDGTDEDEEHAALATLTEALFPTHHNGELGIDIEDMRSEFREIEPLREAQAALDREQQTFAERLAMWMEKKKMSQTDLAARVGVQQPAISMMLKRCCRPQRETITRMAEALGVRAEELWPSNG